MTALLRRALKGRRTTRAIMLLGIVGARLLYGDSIITPAISVMSAVEGLQVVNPGLDEIVLPASVVILTGLFVIQRFGTARVGKSFGPIMVVWFATLAVMGIPQIVAHPQILAALSPVNWMLYAGVLLLIVGFQSSGALANAYGLAVTGTLVLTTVLFFGLAHRSWQWPLWLIVLAMLVIGGLEASFFAANVTKIVHGGWLPIVIATGVIMVMTTWMWGDEILGVRRRELEGSLDAWLEKIQQGGVQRVPGQAIFLHGNSQTVPLALKETLRFNQVIHEQIAIVTVQVLNVPHVRHVDRVQFTDLGRPDDGIVGILISLGFDDSQDVPHNLKWSHGKCPDFEWDPAQARYFLSVLTVNAGAGRGLTLLRKKFFALLTRNAGSRVEAFHLPPNRTAVLGRTVNL